MVLRHDEVDYEPVARQWLGRFEGGLNRLVSVQRLQGILPPSVRDAAPAVVKRSGAKKKGSAHGVAKQPVASELESELSVRARVGGGEGDDDGEDSEDGRPLSSRRPAAALHGPPKPAALGRAAATSMAGTGGSGHGQRGATERAAAPEAKSSESSECESEELGPAAVAAERTWGDKMLRNEEREHKKRKMSTTGRPERNPERHPERHPEGAELRDRRRFHALRIEDDADAWPCESA